MTIMKDLEQFVLLCVDERQEDTSMRAHAAGVMGIPNVGCKDVREGVRENVDTPASKIILWS